MTTKTIKHGTLTGYVNGCRCDPCADARRAYQRDYRARTRTARLAGEPRTTEARQWLADLLHELAPDGLTDDCPARRRLAAS